MTGHRAMAVGVRLVDVLGLAHSTGATDVLFELSDPDAYNESPGAILSTLATWVDDEDTALSLLRLIAEKGDEGRSLIQLLRASIRLEDVVRVHCRLELRVSTAGGVQ